jgi:hypothetical protein
MLVHSSLVVAFIASPDGVKLLDWQDVVDKSHLQDTFELSPDSQAVIMACLVSFLERYQWRFDETEPTDSEWNTIESGISAAINELTIPYDCPVGGGGDYNLIATETLVSDVTTYTLTDLELADGEDLLIQVFAATTNASDRQLRYEINTLVTSIYRTHEVAFATGTSYANVTRTHVRLNNGLFKTQTPQDDYALTQLFIPQWKKTDRYPVIMHDAAHATGTLKGRVTFEDLDSVQEIKFYSQTDDIKAGSVFSVYSRG